MYSLCDGLKADVRRGTTRTPRFAWRVRKGQLARESQRAVGDKVPVYVLSVRRAHSGCAQEDVSDAAICLEGAGPAVQSMS